MLLSPSTKAWSGSFNHFDWTRSPLCGGEVVYWLAGWVSVGGSMVQGLASLFPLTRHNSTLFFSSHVYNWVTSEPLGNPYKMLAVARGWGGGTLWWGSILSITGPITKHRPWWAIWRVQSVGLATKGYLTFSMIHRHLQIDSGVVTVHNSGIE